MDNLTIEELKDFCRYVKFNKKDLKLKKKIYLKK